VKYSGGGCAPVSGRRSCRGCRRGGSGSSRHRCRAQGSVKEFSGDRGSGSQWLNDGKHGGIVVVKGAEEEKGSLHRGGAPFIANGGG
jgi:hypothetical protein